MYPGIALLRERQPLPSLWTLAGRALPRARLTQESEAVRKLVALLDTLWRWVEEIPPAAHTLRYGNPAYRTWSARMAEAAPQVRAAPMLRTGEWLEGRAALLLPCVCSDWLAGRHSGEPVAPCMPQGGRSHHHMLPLACSWWPRCCLRSCRGRRRSCRATSLTALATPHASTTAQATRPPFVPCCTAWPSWAWWGATTRRPWSPACLRATCS